MLYDMKCDICKRVMEVGCPITLFDDIIRPGISCVDAHEDGCKGRLKQIILPPRAIINRSPFPHSGNEVQLPTKHHEDIRFDDKIHAREYLAENGLTSKWIENDM